MTDIEEVPAEPPHFSIELTPEQVAEIVSEAQATPAPAPTTGGAVLVPTEHISTLHSYIDKLEQATGKEWTAFAVFVRTHFPTL